MKDKLKACPFCGAIPKFFDGDYEVEHDDNCFMRMGHVVKTQYLTGIRRIIAWNTRQAEQARKEPKQ